MSGECSVQGVSEANLQCTSACSLKAAPRRKANLPRDDSGGRSGQRFDAIHGVATEAVIFLGEIDPEAIGSALADATHYEAVPPEDFHELMRASPLEPERATFADAGSGLGRAVMLASQYPFKQIVGVEVSLAVERSPRSPDIRLVRADVTKWTRPRETWCSSSTTRSITRPCGVWSRATSNHLGARSCCFTILRSKAKRSTTTLGVWRSFLAGKFTHSPKRHGRAVSRYSTKRRRPQNS